MSRNILDAYAHLIEVMGKFLAVLEKIDPADSDKILKRIETLANYLNKKHHEVTQKESTASYKAMLAEQSERRDLCN